MSLCELMVLFKCGTTFGTIKHDGVTFYMIISRTKKSRSCMTMCTICVSVSFLHMIIREYVELWCLYYFVKHHTVSEHIYSGHYVIFTYFKTRELSCKNVILKNIKETNYISNICTAV
jgi:hypothetical protein